LNRKKVIGKKSKVARKNGTRRRVKLFRGGAPKNILLIIDPQNDFIPNSYKDADGKPLASLAVVNADNDIKKLAKFLEITNMPFDEIHVSLDSHNKTHIAHLGFWDLTDVQKKAINEKGGIVGFRLNPQPTGTTDIAKDFKSIKIELWDLSPDGKIIQGCDNITPRGVVTIDGNEKEIDNDTLKQLAVDYINKLTLMNTIDHSKPLPNTWPDHCIIDNDGWKIYQDLAKVLDSEKYKSKVFIHEKGTNDLVEMYSIFKAEVTYNSLYPRRQVVEYNDAKVPDPSQAVNFPNTLRNYATELNVNFIKRLRGENNENMVYVCGEAKTHCVKTSAEDLVGENGNNVVMLYNVMSDITFPPIFIEPRKTVFKELQKKGVKFATITDDNTIETNVNYTPEDDNYPLKTIIADNTDIVKNAGLVEKGVLGITRNPTKKFRSLL
jgi:nicotinamidase-related amidase